MPKNLTIRIEENLHKKFKLYALENDTDMSRIIIEYINDLVSNKSEKDVN